MVLYLWLICVLFLNDGKEIRNEKSNESIEKNKITLERKANNLAAITKTTIAANAMQFLLLKSAENLIQFSFLSVNLNSNVKDRKNCMHKNISKSSIW